MRIGQLMKIIMIKIPTKRIKLMISGIIQPMTMEIKRLRTIKMMKTRKTIGQRMKSKMTKALTSVINLLIMNKWKTMIKNNKTLKEKIIAMKDTMRMKSNRALSMNMLTINISLQIEISRGNHKKITRNLKTIMIHVSRAIIRPPMRANLKWTGTILKTFSRDRSTSKVSSRTITMNSLGYPMTCIISMIKVC